MKKNATPKKKITFYLSQDNCKDLEFIKLAYEKAGNPLNQSQILSEAIEATAYLCKRFMDELKQDDLTPLEIITLIENEETQ